MQDSAIHIAEGAGYLFGSLFKVLPVIIPAMVVWGSLLYVYAKIKEFNFVVFWEKGRKEREGLLPVTRTPKPKKKVKKTKKAAPKGKHSVVDTFSDEYKLPQLPFN